jgi:hypothetical protein
VPDPTFNQVLGAAMDDVERRGYLTPEQIQEWERLLAEAARRSMTPEHKMKEMVDRGLVRLYEDMVGKARVLRYHPGVPLFTLERIKPYLRPELDKRIAASLGLIRLNKDSVVLKMQQRFAGWATSIPAGGSDNVKRQEVKEGVRKGIAGLRYEERRVLTDQGHKLVSSINQVMALQGSAIAGIWRSHYHQLNYDYREEHKEREIESLKRPFLIKGSWAIKEGYLQTSGARYLEDMTAAGEEPFCRCFVQYLYNIRQMPRDYLTAKGEEFLAASKRKQAA